MKKYIVSMMLICVCSQSYAVKEPLWKGWIFSPGNKYTKIVRDSLLTENVELLNSNPKDILNFCPNFYNLDQDGRIKFWTQLISAMTQRESNFQPDLQYPEKGIFDSHGQMVVSRGLMQMSFESVQNSSYRCDIRQQADLDDPGKNLRCAMGIMRTWMRADRVITAGHKGSWRGIAKYWAVLRTPTTLEIIRGNIYNTSFCRAR